MKLKWPLMGNIFMAAEVARITGLKPREIVDACVLRIINPEIEAKGTGSRRIFSFRNVMQFMIFKILRHWGFSRPSIQKILDTLDKRGGEIYNPQNDNTNQVLIMGEDKEGRRLDLLPLKPGNKIAYDPEQFYCSFLINLSQMRRRIIEAVVKIEQIRSMKKKQAKEGRKGRAQEVKASERFSNNLV